MNKHIKDQFYIINQQVKDLCSIYHEAAAQAKISDNEFWIWYALLLLEDECTQQEICDMWSLPKQTVNSIVSKLVKKNYITLETSLESRNRKLIHLTESGRKYGESVVLKVYESELHVLAKLSEADRNHFIHLLGNYITFLKEEIHGK